MKSFLAFLKKEWMENIRSGRITVLLILFLIFGIMNPAIAKITPWMMEIMADSLLESGMIITEVKTTALTSWTQFFKNIPIGLIAFVLIFSRSFAREYESGTLVLVLTKGLSRYKVILAKSSIMLSLWTVLYYLCFAVTYSYNSYYWDNSIALNLFPAALCWWLFGLLIICLVVLYSSILFSSGAILLCTGATTIVIYIAGMFPQTKNYTPALLMNSSALISGVATATSYTKAAIITAALCVICILISIPIMNKKQI